MSLPHGQLYLTDADSSLSDDEISLLIGHEMSHVLNLHSLELIYIYALSNMLVGPMIFLLWGSSESKYLSAALHFMITSLINGFNNFESRHIELEADLQGMILAANACYNMSICPGFWADMEGMQGRSESLWFREAFMSHPSYSTRSKFAAENIDDIMKMREARGCPPVPPLPPPKPKAPKKAKKVFTLFQFFVLLLKDSVFIMTAIFRSALF
ncbi:metalloendopeptidase OMA1, mitochondrial-like [Brevipalpus obovatus]|uniref:metalloendopeptidase OMA1, mitochondrial-like n=1 Tax=Brevipalpus obovatus TaxID=246614 RepID=UPI003D9E0E71